MTIIQKLNDLAYYEFELKTKRGKLITNIWDIANRENLDIVELMYCACQDGLLKI